MDGSPRVAYLIFASELGGAETMVLAMARGIGARGFSPLVVGLRGEGGFTRAARAAGVPIRVLDIRRDPLAFFRLLSILRRERPAVLQTFIFAANILGRAAGRLAGVPVVLSSQRSTDDWRKARHWMLDALTAPLADAFVSNSHAGARVLERRGVVCPGRIRVIPNGIPLEPPAAGLPAFRREPATLVAGSVGNLRRPKGHPYLVAAASLVLREVPSARFVIAGGGDGRAALEADIRRRGLAEAVTLTGPLADPRPTAASFDVFVLPSLWEGCPVGLLEAMGMGLACVATAVGDVPLILEDGVNGLVVPPRDAGALAVAIVRLLKDEALRRRLGAAAAATVRARYSADRMLDDYAALYRDLAARRGA